jgi:hypothetical protein
MKISALVASAGLLIALASGPALAGKPDDPGAGGQSVKAAVEFVKDSGATWGSVVSEFVHTSDGNLGQAVKSVPGGRPNPANDNGGGND